MYVNDRNTDATPAYTIGNVRVGFEQRRGRWVIREFARLNNFTNRNYVGTVIVGDANGRYFEPAANRNALFGFASTPPSNPGELRIDSRARPCCRAKDFRAVP